MTTLEWTLALAYGVWLVVSVLRQLPWARRFFTEWDAFRVVPLWAMFANPTRHDYTFACRTRVADGVWTTWTDVELIAPRRPWSWLWRPELLTTIAAISCANFAWRATDAAARAELYSSDLWVATASTLARRAGTPNASEIQIVIWAGRTFDPACKPAPVFVSDTVSLEAHSSHVIR